MSAIAIKFPATWFKIGVGFLVPPSRSGQHPMLGERYGPERCGALPGWRGGTNERLLLRHPLSFFRGAKKHPNVYSLTDVPWSQTAHQLLIRGVDGSVELPYEQRAAVLRSQRPLAQLCRNVTFPQIAEA
jgi:hypothetical protein